MAATRGTTSNLTGDGVPEQIVGRAVSPNFFSVLGAQPALGRTFLDEDERSLAPVVVISHALWLRRYAGDPGIIGRTVLMDGAKRTVTGVMPRGFAFRNRDVDFWITPLYFSPDQAVARNAHFLNVVARLQPGTTIERARDDMRDVAQQLAREYPASNARVGASVEAIRTDAVGDTRLELLVLVGAAACVLLIACANLAGLLLSRAFARRSEMAVRAAIGATRRRLMRQMLVESLLLSGAGGALGLAFAPLAMTMLEALVPVGVAHSVSPLDLRLLGFTAALSIATGILFGIVPAAQAARSCLHDALKQGSRSGGARTHATTRDALVVLQVAAALVLLAGAGLMLRTLANLHAIDVGFRADHVLTMRTTLPREKYRDPLTRLAFYDRVVDGVKGLPGVTSVGYGSTLPFLSQGNTTGYQVEGRTLTPGDPADATLRVGAGDYLRTMGVRLVDGRLFDESDRQQAPPIVVINETFARQYWPGERAVGRRISFSGPTSPSWRTIVGVVRDVRERGYELQMKPGVYLPFAQALDTWALPEYLVVRAAADPLALAAPVRDAIARVDAEQPISAVRTIDDILEQSVADRRQQWMLLGSFSILAVLLASIGLYGVLSYAVTQRSREIGLRLALGATTGAVTRIVIGRGLALTSIGLAIGVAIAWGATRSMQSFLYGVGASDPATFGAVVALLGFVALIACTVPALRASRVDPIEVLRQE
jgi:predicted permease